MLGFLFHWAYDSHKLAVVIKAPKTYCVCKSQTEIIAHEIMSLAGKKGTLLLFVRSFSQIT